MMQLSDPDYCFENSLDQCISGITGNQELLRKVISSKQNLITKWLSYVAAANIGELYTIEAVNADRNTDPFIIGELKKSELTKLYDQYFVPESKPARKIYNALFNAAKEKCPFCGGIGTPRNLDHFLPVAHFPQFSVLPQNLVPACRDCNQGAKGHTYATSADEQVIQPYLDKKQFFVEQWIFATYHRGKNDDPGNFEYFVNPPNGWDDADKKKASKHFENFDLAKRYSTKAAESLGTVLSQIKLMQRKGIIKDDIIEVLLQPGVDKSPFANHWQKGMYQSLIQDLNNHMPAAVLRHTFLQNGLKQTAKT